MTTSAPVPGSPTPRELAVADGSVQSYRIGPWSSWGIRCKNRPARRQSGKAARGVCSLTAETNPLALRVVQILRNSQVIRAGESLTVRSAARFTPDGSNSTRFRPSGRQKSAKQSPIEISHKALSLKELTSDGFGILYAKQTQFRVVEAATLEGWRCREPARKQLLPQPRYAQILTTDSAQQHPIEGPGGSETNHGIHRHTQKREFGSALPFRVLPFY